MMNLPERIAFDEYVQGEDSAFGGKKAAPIERFATRAGFVYLRGGEKVLSGRLAGVQTLVATVRASSLTRGVSTTWRLRDLSKDVAYNIRAVEPNRRSPRLYLDFLCETEVK